MADLKIPETSSQVNFDAALEEEFASVKTPGHALDNVVDRLALLSDMLDTHDACVTLELSPNGRDGLAALVQEVLATISVYRDAVDCMMLRLPRIASAAVRRACHE